MSYGIENAAIGWAQPSPEDCLMEIVEVANHPWFVAVQFHPEFKSRPDNAHPLFTGFIEAAVKYASKAE